ncbi:MAG: CoA transferase [Bryobacteraceae bacterium]
MPAPLEGILVLDFTRAVAGPYCTLLLADLGARVIKVEEPGSGDETRKWGPPFVGPASAYYLSMNRNKQSIVADLKSEAGRKLVRAIAAKADVVIENFRPGVIERLGFGYADLARTNPGIVYASVSGFGQTGPDRLKSGYDLIVQAMSGSMYTSASAEQKAVKVSYPVCDLFTAMFAGQAILAALVGRNKTGQGRFIEVALLESVLCAMSALASGVLATGQEPVRVGTAQHHIVPYQLFDCADQPIMCGSPNDRLWRKFCEVLGHPEWPEDPRFADNPSRVHHRDVLVPMIQQVLLTATAAEWVERMEKFDIPCGPVLSLSQALEHRQVKARGVVVEGHDEKLGSVRWVGNPMRMEGYEPPRRVAPELGADTAAVEKEFLG